MESPFGSLLTAIITPFDADGSIAWSSFRSILRHLRETGSDGVVIAGTTGEAPTLSDDEKLELCRVAIDEVGDHMSVLAGTGSNNTAHSEQLSRAACDLGVDGLLIVTPYYNRPPREGLVQHFTRVAQASSRPVMLYNVPSRVVTNLEPDLIAELGAIDNVVAVKQANPDLRQAQEIRTLAPDLALYAGDDQSLMSMLPLGAVGVVSVGAHVVGAQMRRLIDAYHAGDEATARSIASELEDAFDTLTLTTNPIPVKAALAELGFAVGTPRLPMVDVTTMQRDRIRGMLQRQGVVSAHV